jgi:transposase
MTGMEKNTMGAKQTHGRTVGLDLGDRTSHYCILDEEGEVVGRGELKSTREEFAVLFGGMPRSRVVMEVGTHSPWASEQLEAWHEVIVANAQSVRALLKGRRKNDRADAEGLARLGRSEVALLRAVHHRSIQVQQDRAVLELREGLVEARAKLVNQLRGVLKSLGHRLEAKSYKTLAGSVKQLPEELQTVVKPTLEVIAGLNEGVKQLDREVARLGEERYPATQLLQRVAGVGPVISLAFVLTLEDPGRFGRSREVGPYLGLVPGQHDSGKQQPQLRITKAGDKAMRRLLVQGAHYIVGRHGPDSDLKRWAEPRLQLGGGHGKKRTIVAVARKLAVLLHHLWVSGEVYEPLYQANRREGQAAA